jgi:hypothetical protein
MTTINESIDTLTTKLSKSDLNDTFKEKVISALKSLYNLNLKSSDEGSTNDGDHETGVSNALIKLGFPIISKKYVEHKKIKKDKTTLTITTFIMDRTTHEPTKDLIVPIPDGYYQIPQPYSNGRGSFNPAPDNYLVNIRDKKVTEWLGLECKSSKSMKPTWNDNLPRDFRKGNIIYLFSGFMKEKSINVLMTAEIFFNNVSTTIVDDIYEKTNNYLNKLWKDEGLDVKLPMLKCLMRQKCEQSKSITEEQAKEYTKKTFEFLESIESYALDTIIKEKVINKVSKSNVI